MSISCWQSGSFQIPQNHSGLPKLKSSPRVFLGTCHGTQPRSPRIFHRFRRNYRNLLNTFYQPLVLVQIPRTLSGFLKLRSCLRELLWILLELSLSHQDQLQDLTGLILISLVFPTDSYDLFKFHELTQVSRKLYQVLQSDLEFCWNSSKATRNLFRFHRPFRLLKSIMQTNALPQTSKI